MKHIKRCETARIRAKQIYGKRQFAIRLVSRGERMRTIVRIIVSIAVVTGVFASVYE
jgi:hypothetical protein